MALMMSTLYDALLEGGAKEETARKAADEVATYENCFAKVDSDLNLLKWMAGFNLAITAAVLAKLLV
jgi:hypothetical protein